MLTPCHRLFRDNIRGRKLEHRITVVDIYDAFTLEGNTSEHEDLKKQKSLGETVHNMLIKHVSRSNELIAWLFLLR